MRNFKLSVRRGAFLALFAIGVSIGGGAAQAQQAACQIFMHDKLKGSRTDLAAGERVRKLPPAAYRNGTSVRLQGSCKLTIFDDERFRGDSVTITRSTNIVPSGWNDRMESAICSCEGAGRADDDRRGGGRGDDEGRRGGGRDDRAARDRGRDPSSAPRLRRRGAACIAWKDRGNRGAWRAFEAGQRDRFGRRLRGDLGSVEVARGCRATIELDGRPFRVIIDRSTDRLPPFISRNAGSLSCRCGR